MYKYTRLISIKNFWHIYGTKNINKINRTCITEVVKKKS